MANGQLKALLAHDADSVGGWGAEHIPSGPGIIVAGIVDRLPPTPDEVRESGADVLVVACTQQQREGALALVRWWAENRPNRPVVVLSEASPNGFVGRAFSAGADDLIVVEPGYQV